MSLWKCINTIDSPDDEHSGARNMYRIITKYIRKKELGVKLVIYKNWTEMHDQQNRKLPISYRETNTLPSGLKRSDSTNCANAEDNNDYPFI
jgi:hypothetical protein